MSALFKQRGATLDISILASDEAQDFIQTHATQLDSSFSSVAMTDTMRERLTRSDYIFSGLKTFHELNEAFPSLLDENGERKTFEQFLNDVRKIDQTYNQNYLRAEYNFIQSSAHMAAKWEQFTEDGDRYLLQYRTAHDDRVRPAHAALEGVTLPPSDTFWESYYPPNGWNCRCSVVQVLRTNHTETPHDEAEALGELALQDDTKGIFRFNSGREQKTVPDYNPYTIRRCRDCDVAKGRLTLAFVPENQLCEACKLINTCEKNRYDTYRFGKGSVSISHLVNPKDSDFVKLVDIAENFARTGSTVKLTPKMSRPPKFQYECVYESLVGTKYEGKCPDLNIDGKWYEHEGFVTDNPKNAFRNMMHDGLMQSNRLIIDRPELTARYMRRGIIERVRRGEDIAEVWLREANGECTLLYKKTDG